jgi:superfamily II DNA/RNA helicase
VHELDLSKYRDIVVDECETMITEDYAGLIRQVADSDARMTYVSAIYSNKLRDILNSMYHLKTTPTKMAEPDSENRGNRPVLQLIVEKNTHKALKNIDYEFIYVSEAERLIYLTNIIKEHPKQQYVVF